MKTSSSSMTSSLELYNIDDLDDFFSFKYCDDLTVLMDLKCSNISSLLQMASELNFFNSTRKWIFIGDEDLNVSISYISTLNINIDSHITLLQEQENGNFDVYHIGSPSLGRSNIFEVDLVATYFEAHGILKHEKLQKFVKKDLQGIRLIVAIAVNVF